MSRRLALLAALTLIPALPATAQRPPRYTSTSPVRPPPWGTVTPGPNPGQPPRTLPPNTTTAPDPRILPPAQRPPLNQPEGPQTSRGPVLPNVSATATPGGLVTLTGVGSDIPAQSFLTMYFGWLNHPPLKKLIESTARSISAQVPATALKKPGTFTVSYTLEFGHGQKKVGNVTFTIAPPSTSSPLVNVKPGAGLAPVAPRASRINAAVSGSKIAVQFDAAVGENAKCEADIWMPGKPGIRAINSKLTKGTTKFTEDVARFMQPGGVYQARVHLIRDGVLVCYADVHGLKK